MPKFIVIAGKKQAGKTTVARYIKSSLTKWRADLTVDITSFAAPIKDFCINVIGLTEDQVYGSNKDKDSPTHIKWDTMPSEIKWRYSNIKEEVAFIPGVIEPMTKPLVRSGFMSAREVMQIFGTDIIRNFFDYDIWAKAPFAKKWGFTDYVIIDDCRFPNEANIALKNGATLIKLTRDVLKGDVHISEKALDEYPQEKYTYIIDNQNYTELTTLYKDIMNILKSEINK